MEIQIPFGDLEKFVPLPGQSYPPNPYYTVADYYYPMQQITDGNEAEGIIVAMDKQRNLKSYKFTNREAYVKERPQPQSRMTYWQSLGLSVSASMNNL
ncbi:hypothetical protein PHET_12191 [Paragonimus heterotremus]|uniref:Uncharacterized protein n=1 Tax=Paragonimus heterotremus TaxID=100268 RepID=A0A8J4T5Q3_9TREM|nr:hypothetical protein PHET_12191 [Paragonimus heterotremus]